MLDPNAEILNRAMHLMRSAWSCTLLYDEAAFESQCMIDPRSGEFLVGIVSDAQDARDIVLACPRDSFDARLRISVELSEQVSEEQCDRFTAYHLPATTPLLARATYEYAKLDSGEVVTPDQCPLVNPLVDQLGPLCRALNADRERLARVCLNLSGVEHESPLAVGVDPDGIDIRARFGLVRMVLPEPITDHEHALDTIRRLLENHDA
ncbi:MAG: hypothetical protein JJ974_12030 [Phycisphaerales bacterium]|nr:hypothetical protein [Phycisphaerales bacterium]